MGIIGLKQLICIKNAGWSIIVSECVYSETLSFFCHHELTSLIFIILTGISMNYVEGSALIIYIISES
jgi:hypothetical protein